MQHWASLPARGPRVHAQESLGCFCWVTVYIFTVKWCCQAVSKELPLSSEPGEGMLTMVQGSQKGNEGGGCTSCFWKTSEIPFSCHQFPKPIHCQDYSHGSFFSAFCLSEQTHSMWMRRLKSFNLIALGNCSWNKSSLASYLGCFFLRQWVWGHLTMSVSFLEQAHLYACFQNQNHSCYFIKC